MSGEDIFMVVSVRTVLRQVPDPRGKQGRQHPLDARWGRCFCRCFCRCSAVAKVCRLHSGWGAALHVSSLHAWGFAETAFLLATRHSRKRYGSLIQTPWPGPSASSSLSKKIRKGMKRYAVSFRLMARPFAAVRTQMAMPSMFCRLFTQHLANL
jgi:hypothetical protein